MSNNRRPDYILKAIHHVTHDRSPRLGAAWKNADGTVSIIMDLGCSLAYGPELTVMLFPNDAPVSKDGRAPV